MVHFDAGGYWVPQSCRGMTVAAKAMGFDTKALRSVVRLRKQDETERREQEAVLDTYLHALGMLAE